MAFIATGLGELIFGDKAFGKKPDVPYLGQTNPDAIQKQTIQGNLDALPGIQNLQAQQNSFNINQALEMTRRSLEFVPGGSDAVQGIIGSRLRGEVPADVQAQLMRSGTARGFGSVGGSSPFTRNLTLRDLGITSWQSQAEGMKDLKSFAPNVPLANMSSMFRTPSENIDLAFKQNETNFNREWLANQVNAAPDPFASAFTQALIHDENEILKTISSVAGMAGGAACWLARAVLGTRDNRWRLVRIWLFTEAPISFRDFYLKHGERLSNHIDAYWRAVLYEPLNRIAIHVAKRYA